MEKYYKVHGFRKIRKANITNLKLKNLNSVRKCLVDDKV